MGFGFKLVNNDWVLNGLGKVDQVTGKEKLKRDLNKIFVTFKKDDYGQEIDEMVGTKIRSPKSKISEIKRRVQDTLRRFVQFQEKDLTISDEEKLGAAQVFVYPHLDDPTKTVFTMRLYNALRESLGNMSFETG